MSATRPITTFAGEQTVLITSFRRDGTPVDTPVHIAFEGDRAFVRSYEAAWKTKRLRRRPAAELWHATHGAEPALVGLLTPGRTRRTGRPLPVRAVELRGTGERPAITALRRRYPFLHGVVIPLMHRVKRTRTVHFELVATAGEVARASRVLAGGA